MIPTFDDQTLDREIRAYLDWRTERVSEAPSAAEMASLVGRHVGLRPQPNWVTSRTGWVLAAALLALALVGVLIMGGGINRLHADRTPAPTSAVPVNGWIAYPTRAHDAGNGVLGEILLVTVGNAPRRIAGGTVETICPQFSPDGTKLSYVEGNDLVVLEGDPAQGMREAYRSSRAGRTAGACPIWSPSSQAIAFLAGDGIAVRGLDGVDRTIAAPTPRDVTGQLFGNHNPLAWSPDGSSIAYAAGDGIWLVPVDGRSAQRLSAAQSRYVSWSSDGSRIVFADELQLQDKGVSNITVLTINQPSDAIILGRGTKPAWAPLADEIAALTDGGLTVYRADRSGSRILRLASAYGFGGWSPDGGYALIMVDVSGQSYDLIAISTTGGDPVPIARAVNTGGSRNFPDMGDVSWQAHYP
jgi:Tol biopolymer transport system component